MTLLQKLDRLPPYVVRILARKNGILISDADILKMTGWRRRQLRRVSWATSWKDVTVGEVDAFLKACGMSWSQQRRQRYRLRQLVSTNLYSMRHLRYRYGTKQAWYAQCIKSHQKRFEKILIELARKSNE